MSIQALSKRNRYKTTRRLCYARNVGAITAILAIIFGAVVLISSQFRAPQAAAHVDPPGCTTNGLDIDITPSTTLVQHGDIITYVVCFDNDSVGDCTVTEVESTLTLPDGIVITVLSDATIAGPDDPMPGEMFCCPSTDLRCMTAGPYEYEVAHDDETGPVMGCPPQDNGEDTIKIVAAHAEFMGTVHISLVDLDGSAQGCKAAPAVVQHGACCFPDEDDCQDEFGQTECEEAGGMFKGVDSVCLPPEACCLPDDTCKFIDPECCVLEGGTPKGKRTECGGLEACCFDDGTCQVMDSTCCLNAEGTPEGEGSDCESASCGLSCRMTGGGHAENQENRYTWGGQIGAPTADKPQPCGQWTHRQHNGPGGKWTFHAGTASAPPGTEIDLVICCDAGWCDPARPAPAKQIKFEGVGTFKNLHIPPNPDAPEEDQPVAGETFHWFEARVEDMGEPGSHGSDDPKVCPPEGFNCSTGDCACADFYTIRIFNGFNPKKKEPNKTDMIYEIYGYLEGGNHQIHPPIPGDHNCHGGGN